PAGGRFTIQQHEAAWFGPAQPYWFDAMSVFRAEAAGDALRWEVQGLRNQAGAGTSAPVAAWLDHRMQAWKRGRGRLVLADDRGVQQSTELYYPDHFTTADADALEFQAFLDAVPGLPEEPVGAG